MLNMGADAELVPPSIKIALLTVDRAAGERFVATVCGAGSSLYEVDQCRIHLELLVYRPEAEQEIASALTDAQAAALLVNHIDAVSMDQLRAAYRLLPSEHTLPASILLLREAGKWEFKMSCPACGQKLWVRDADAGRNGRCPHCKKSFVLPVQTSLLKSTLMPPETIPLVTVTDGHSANCRGPIGALAERARLQAQALKSATMRVQVTDAAPEAEAPGSSTT